MPAKRVGCSAVLGSFGNRRNQHGFAWRCIAVNSIDPKKLDQPEKEEDGPLKEVDPPTEDTSADATIHEIEHLREKQGGDEEPEEAPLKEQE